jgi:hypothetical protein
LLLVVLGLAVAASVASTASALSFVDEICPPQTVNGLPMKVCPSGSTGTAYSLQIKGRNGCWPADGSSPAGMVTLAVINGGLPPGLSMSSSGLISGTPTQAGVSQFWISETDHAGVNWCGDNNSSQKEFQIAIVPGLAPLSLDTTSVLPATLNVPYSAQLSATPTETQTWTVDTGVLPPGLSLDPRSGRIAGTPTTEGSYHFAVTVSDSLGRSARREYTIDVAAAVTISTPQLTRSEVSVPFDAALTAAGGTGAGTYAWTVSAGTIPPGLVLGAQGAITGTPTTAGGYGFTATATDQAGRTANDVVTITVAAKFALSTLAIWPGKVGKPYLVKLTTTGGVLPNRWKVTNGRFPAGIRLGRQLGVISGTPLQAGRFRFTVHATDALGVTAQKTFLLIVTPKAKKGKG